MKWEFKGWNLLFMFWRIRVSPAVTAGAVIMIICDLETEAREERMAFAFLAKVQKKITRHKH